MTRQKVLFRADASSQMGAGHVMRCLTLAAVLNERHFDCVFASRSLPEQLVRRVQQQGHALIRLDDEADSGSTTVAPIAIEAVWPAEMQIEDSRRCLALAPESGFAWVVVDHYGLDERWETAIKSGIPSVMVIDDLAGRTHACDLLLDQSLGREVADYEGLVPVVAKVLAGPVFALLRPEFAALRAASLKRRSTPELKRLLVSIGGSDPHNLTSMLLRHIDEIELFKGVEITVVLGGLAPFAAEVHAVASAMAKPTTVLFDVDNLAALMAQSDLAIGAAGGTAWERCCLGLPSIVLVLSENQRVGANALEAAGCAIVVSVNPVADLRRQLENAFRRMKADGLREAVSRIVEARIDGRGATRVADALVQLAEDHGHPRLRKVESRDFDLLLSWRNSETIRSSMLTQELITPGTHSRWFEGANVSDDRRLFIFEQDGRPMGFMNLKLDHGGETATWGFYKSPDAPRGVGRVMCKMALSYAFGQLGIKKLWAEVLPHNELSKKLHLALGFQLEPAPPKASKIDSAYSGVVYYGLLKRDWVVSDSEHAGNE